MVRTTLLLIFLPLKPKHLYSCLVHYVDANQFNFYVLKYKKMFSFYLCALNIKGGGGGGGGGERQVKVKT